MITSLAAATPTEPFIVDFPFLLPFIVAVIGIILGFIYFSKNYKNTVASALRLKQLDEISIAKELEAKSQKATENQKQEMKEYIINTINNLRQDIAIQNSNLKHEMDLMKHMDLQTQKDLLNYIQEQTRINEKMEKSINFVSQFLWGQGAKSIPPFLEGKEETQEHKDEPGEGIFRSPDSSETQEMKDDNKKKKEK